MNKINYSFKHEEIDMYQDMNEDVSVYVDLEMYDDEETLTYVVQFDDYASIESFIRLNESNIQDECE